MSTCVVNEDNEVTLPEWVLEALDLREGDAVEFIPIPGQVAYRLEKVVREQGSPPGAADVDGSTN